MIGKVGDLAADVGNRFPKQGAVHVPFQPLIKTANTNLGAIWIIGLILSLTPSCGGVFIARLLDRDMILLSIVPHIVMRPISKGKHHIWPLLNVMNSRMERQLSFGNIFITTLVSDAEQIPRKLHRPLGAVQEFNATLPVPRPIDWEHICREVQVK